MMMSSLSFPIHHTFAPLATPAQRALAFRLQFQPWRWREGPEAEELRRELSRSFGASAALFATGRDALLAALRALELHPGEEVIVQAFTCIAVPNAVHAAQGVAVYVDIDPRTLTLDCDRVQRAITGRTRAIICQHTFGIPAETKKLRAICDRRGLALIEDCAHIIPDLPPGAPQSEGGCGNSQQMSLLRAPSAGGGIGVHGDMFIFSFGRDKAISGVTGGAALTRHPMIASRLERMEQEAFPLTLWQIANLLGYPLRYELAKRLWTFNIGKAYLRILKSVGLLPPIYAPQEKQGKVGLDLHRLPNACALLALEQLRSIGAMNDHRRALTMLYHRAAEERGWNIPSGIAGARALQKFPLFVPDASAVRMALKREQVHLDDGWWGTAVTPPSCDQEAAGYAAGSCPRAEDVARRILTLPTHPTMMEAQARYLIHALRSLLPRLQESPANVRS